MSLGDDSGRQAASVHGRRRPTPRSASVVSRREVSMKLSVFCRFDYHLATPGIAAKARREHIYLEQRFSDHAPLIVDYDFRL